MSPEPAPNRVCKGRSNGNAQMSDLLIGLGIALIAEGLLWALVPGFAEKCLQLVASTPPAQVRSSAWTAVVTGLVIVWLIGVAGRASSLNPQFVPPPSTRHVDSCLGLSTVCGEAGGDARPWPSFWPPHGESKWLSRCAFRSCCRTGAGSCWLPAACSSRACPCRVPRRSAAADRSRWRRWPKS